MSQQKVGVGQEMSGGVSTCIRLCINLRNSALLDVNSKLAYNDATCIGNSALSVVWNRECVDTV